MTKTFTVSMRNGKPGPVCQVTFTPAVQAVLLQMNATGQAPKGWKQLIENPTTCTAQGYTPAVAAAAYAAMIKQGFVPVASQH